jgi:multidrug resistance efflux pump
LLTGLNDAGPKTNSNKIKHTGTVASWKTDQLGFEVAGRVEFVVEPETDIIGHASGRTARGTELARLDPTRYELSVESAKAEILTAEKQREAARITRQRHSRAARSRPGATRPRKDGELERN